MVPTEYSAGRHRCRGLRHGVNPCRTRKSRRSNMQRHEHSAALCVRERRAIVEGRIFVATPRLQNLKTLRLERAADLHRQVQHQVAFANALRSPCAWIGAAMGGIDHDDVQSSSLRCRRGDGGVGWSRNR